MQTIKIYLKESGSVAELVKDFNLYAGSYQNKLLDVYVPTGILYTATNIDNGVKVGGLLIAPNGSQITTKSYYLNFVRNETVFNEFEQKDIEYAVYERLLPKEFTLFSGDQKIVTNVVTIDNTGNKGFIKQIVTTQTATLVVQESTYLNEEEPIESDLSQELASRITENEKDIDALQKRVSTNETNIRLNTEEISKNAQEIDNIKSQYTQPEEYIGQKIGTKEPTDEELTQFVIDEEHRQPKNADVIIFILQVEGETDKNYKYIYSTNGWNGYEIPPMETAKNGELGLIEGTFNIGSSNSTIVDIVGGQIVNIYVKDSTGTLRNIQEYSNTLKSSIDDIISGKTQVGNSLKATQDKLGNDITNTYLNKNEGATKDYVKNYALPKQFNDVSYITDGGYSENIPSVSFSATSSTVGSTQLFDITKTAGAKYQISNKNSYDNVVFISASANCTVEFRLTTKIKGQVVNVEVNDNINLTAGGISRITFRDTFDYLEENVLKVEENDIIEQILEVITSTSETIVFTVYSNSIYPSKFYLNTQLTVIKTSSGSLGEQLILGADGVLEADNYNFTVQDAEEYEVYKKNGTKFLVDLFLPVVGDLVNTNKVSITFGDTTYWIFNVLHGASKHATIGDLKQVQHYTNDLGYRWICEMTYFENNDLSGFAIIPTISMSDVLSLTSDEMDNYLADGGLAQGQLAICGKLINNGYVEGALYRFDIVYPDSYTWTVLSRTSSITKVSDTDIITDEFKGIVYLTEQQYGDLIRDGQITVNNETIVYSDDVQYITPDTSYSIIQGNVAPDKSTKGEVGQFYLHIVDNDNSWLYICINNANKVYLWKMLSIEEVLLIKSNISNPNLLINGDFRVNQRGQQSYGKGYTVDRWYSNLTYLNFDVASKTLTNNDTAYSGYFIQYIENQEDLYGKTVTFSSLVNGTRYSLTATIPSDTTVSTVAYTSIKGNNITKCQLEIGFTNNLLNVRYVIPIGQSVTIGEAKLEIGLFATAFSPRPYAEELSLCQRYYLPLMNGASVYNGFIFTETSARISVPVPTTMRLRTPTAEFKVDDITQCKIYSNGAQVTPTALGYAGFVDSDQFVINATIPNLTPNHTCAMRLLGSASLDAEIY